MSRSGWGVGLAWAIVLASCGGSGGDAPDDASPTVVASSAAPSSTAPSTIGTTASSEGASATTLTPGSAPTPPRAALSVEILGSDRLELDTEFVWQVDAPDAVSGRWESDCGVGDNRWEPGGMWGGSYGGVPRQCTLTLTVEDADGRTATDTHAFELFAPPLSATINGTPQLAIGQEFFWTVTHENAVRGSWSSDCGVGDPTWEPGTGWGGSYGGPERTCTLTLMVFDSAERTFTTSHVFEIVAG